MSKLPWWDPAQLAQALAARFGQQGLVWLDGDGSNLGRWALLAVAPIRIERCVGLPGSDGSRDPFALLQECFQATAAAGTWLGWLAYEAGAWVEPGDHWQSPDMALLWAGHYEAVLHLDLQQRELHLAGAGALQKDLEALLFDGPAPRNHQHKGELGDPAGNGENAWHWHTPPQRFGDQVRQVREWISSGDLFQANLTACAEQQRQQPPDPLGLYLQLRSSCPAPFGGLIVADAAEAVLSASPERFLQLNSAGAVETRPIKGTRPRHSDPLLDAAAAAELITSAKDRAENVMIVDLLRNDLGRVCVPGSIEVPQLLGLESYAQVHHLTSVVSGQLRAELGVVDLLRACWPGGSITGAPKIRACQRLNSLEPLPRGPYCGSFFRRDADGSFDSNILIRSVLLRQGRLRVHGGCGIVADSEPALEAEELSWKVQPLLAALGR
jgi:para-aminobenzoate synthetase component 1